MRRLDGETTDAALLDRLGDWADRGAWDEFVRRYDPTIIEALALTGALDPMLEQQGREEALVKTAAWHGTEPGTSEWAVAWAKRLSSRSSGGSSSRPGRPAIRANRAARTGPRQPAM